MSVLPGVRSRMNGALSTQPPGGVGSGSSVTKGGPASTKLIVNHHPKPNIMPAIFNQTTSSDRLPDLVTTNLCRLAATMRNSDKQGVSFRHKKPGARAIRGLDLRRGFVVAWISLLDDVDLPSATDRVNAMALTVVENVIGIAGDVDLGNDIARSRVEDDEL